VPTISSAEADNVLTAAAISAAQKLSGYCVKAVLEKDWMDIGDARKPGGWVDAPDSKSLHYRWISSAERNRLPDAALAAFPKAKIKKDCHHTLVFHKPDFVQIRIETETYISAMITFEDRCPLCGSGYSVSFRKDRGAWVIDSSGITQTWIS
jgi:hypothetical protein